MPIPKDNPAELEARLLDTSYLLGQIAGDVQRVIDVLPEIQKLLEAAQGINVAAIDRINGT